MKNEYTPEPLKINKDLEGLTLKSVQEHQKLYEGYVKKSNEIRAKIAEADKSEANAVYSHIGELKREETFAMNGMKLHETYFGLLTEGDGEPKGALVKMIEADFGSLDAWKEDFAATGISSRGWAVLAFDFKDNQLHNYGADAQNVGAVWSAVPLIAMDVYEHAFFMDHGTNKKAYIDAFFKNLNWDFANKTVKHYDLDSKHGK